MQVIDYSMWHGWHGECIITGMIQSTLTIFPEVMRDAEKVRDAMNATLPPNNQVAVSHVLTLAAGIGMGELMRQFNIQPKVD